MAKPATVVVNVNDVPAIRALDNIARKFSDVGRRVQSIGKAISLGGVAASAPLGFSAKAFADTDDALRAVGVISDSTEKEMAKLRDTAKSFDTFAPRDVAAEMLKLAQAGLSASDSMKAVASSLALQRIDPEIGNQASEIVTKIAVPFGKTARDFEHIADILAIAASRSTTSVGNLGIAMGYAANQGELAGLSIEQSAAAMAILADNGIDASRAGTNLRGILSTLVAKQKKFAELGVQILDKSGEVRKIEEIFRDLNRAMAGMGNGERLAALTDIFGKLYSGGAAGLLKDAERFDSLVAEMERADGAALRWADAMDAGAGGAIRSLKTEVTSISESVGKQLAPAIIVASERFREISKSVQRFVENNALVVQSLAGIAAAAVIAGPPLVVLGYSIQGISLAMASASANGARLLTVMNAVTASHLAQAVAVKINAAAHLALAAAKLLANPAGLVALVGAAGALATLTGAFARLGVAIAAFQFGREFSKQSGVVQIVMGALKRAIGGVYVGLKALAGTAVAAFKRFGTGVKTAGGLLASLLDPRNILRGIQALAAKITEPFRDVFRGVAAVIGPAALEAFRTVEAIASGAFIRIARVAESALSYVARLFDPIVRAVLFVAKTVSAPFVAAFRILGREIAAFASGAVGFLGGLATEGTRIAGQLAAGFSEIFRDVLPSIELISEALREGNYQRAIDLAVQAAEYAFKVGFLEIQIAWQQFVGYFARSFDSAVQGVIARMQQAANEMADALAPIVGVLAELENRLHRVSRQSLNKGVVEVEKTDQQAAADAVADFRDRIREFTKPLADVQKEIADTAKAATEAAQQETAGLRRQIEELRATFNRRRFDDMLPGFLSDVTSGAQGFGQAMLGAVAPIGGLLEGIGWRAGEAMAEAVATHEALTAQVFSGAGIGWAGLATGAADAQLAESRKHTAILERIEEGIGDIELGLPAG